MKNMHHIVDIKRAQNFKYFCALLFYKLKPDNKVKQIFRWLKSFA